MAALNAKRNSSEMDEERGMEEWGTDEEVGVEGDGEDDVGEGEVGQEAEEGDWRGGDPVAAGRAAAEARREREETGGGWRSGGGGIGDEAREADLPLVCGGCWVLNGIAGYHGQRARHFFYFRINQHSAFTAGLLLYIDFQINTTGSGSDPSALLAQYFSELKEVFFFFFYNKICKSVWLSKNVF